MCARCAGRLWGVNFSDCLSFISLSEHTPEDHKHTARPLPQRSNALTHAHTIIHLNAHAVSDSSSLGPSIAVLSSSLFCVETPQPVSSLCVLLSCSQVSVETNRSLFYLTVVTHTGLEWLFSNARHFWTSSPHWVGKKCPLGEDWRCLSSETRCPSISAVRLGKKYDLYLTYILSVVHISCSKPNSRIFMSLQILCGFSLFEQT